MNFSELIINEDNATFNVNETKQQQQQQPDEFVIFITVQKVLGYVSIKLGIPGNILSAIVWLRLHVASKNSSAVYLAALAINDLVYLLIKLSYELVYNMGGCFGWLCYCHWFLIYSTTHCEPALVLGFSVERLIAISCPLQVRCMYSYQACRERGKGEFSRTPRRLGGGGTVAHKY